MGSPWGAKKVMALPCHWDDGEPSVYVRIVGTQDSRSLAVLFSSRPAGQ